MRVFLSLVVATFLLGADSPSDAVKKELARLEGEWSMVSGEHDGQKIPEDLLKSAKRVMKDGETAVSFSDMVYMKAKITVDPSKKPKAIDYVVSEGSSKGKTVLGIYEIDGDTVKFCFADPDKERPTDFTTKVDSGRVLSVWKRNKK